MMMHRLLYHFDGIDVSGNSASTGIYIHPRPVFDGYFEKKLKKLSYNRL